MMNMNPADAIRRELESLAPAGTGDRRSFLAGILAGGFALAVQPIHAQTRVSTDTRGIRAGAVEVPAGDIAMPAYQARPDGEGPFPVVLVVQEIFGVHEWVQDICRRLAKAGYLAVAPELYFRQGDPRKESSIPALMEKIVSRVPDEQVMHDLDATAAWAAANGGDGSRLAITGFCWGGRITWLYVAHNPAVRTGVAWYGRLSGATGPLTPRHPLDVADRIKAPVLGLYAGKDGGIPQESVEAMRAAIARNGGHSELVVYPDAEHGFMADYRPSYNKAAAEDGWKRLLAWLKAHGV